MAYVVTCREGHDDATLTGIVGGIIPVHEESGAAQGIVALGTQAHDVRAMGTRGLRGDAFQFPDMVPASGYGTHIMHALHGRVVPAFALAGIPLPDKERPSFLDVLFRLEEAYGDG